MTLVSLRTVILTCLLLAVVFGYVGCHNDQRIIDKHEQTLLEEED